MFDQSQIVDVKPPIVARGELFLSWVSTAAAMTWYQVYVNRRLKWSGRANSAVVPAPVTLARIDIGTVGAGEARTDFSASLPHTASNRALLEWGGGTFLDPTGNRDIAGFFVYASPTAAGYGTGGYGAGGYGTGTVAINYATPIATVQAYTDGVVTDGYGMGGYGAGGYGSADAIYSWVSAPLTGGTWSFAVTAYNREGTIGAVTTVDLSIVAPPRPPASSQGGSRVSYTLAGYGVGGYGGQGYGASGYGVGPYGGGLGYGQSEAVLTWLPSAG